MGNRKPSRGTAYAGSEQGEVLVRTIGLRGEIERRESSMNVDEEDDDIELVSFTDAAAIGFKVVEMADRLKDVAAAVPGSQAKWGFEIDGVRYQVVLTCDQG